VSEIFWDLDESKLVGANLKQSDLSVVITFPMCEDLETSLEKLQRVALMPSFWAYCAVIYFLFWPVVGTDLDNLRDWTVQAGLTLAVKCCYISSHYFFVTLATNIQATRARVIYPAGFAVLMALCFSLVFEGVMVNPIAPGFATRSSFDLWSNAIFSILSIITFEWFYHRYVFWKFVKTTPELKNIKIGTQDVVIEELLYIQGREHHVCMATVNGDIVERSRLRDLMLILQDIPSVHPHRSYWVRRDAIDFALDRGVKSVLSVRGTEIPIARTRRAEVFGWLRKNDIDIRSDGETS